MKKTVSVIIPVYNVAAYLPQCLDSVLCQQGCDLEVILIDDGSTDGSGTLCDAYAKKDSRVRVIHQQNGGAAAAKNAGLDATTGEYLSFVDSDDYLEPGAYAHMLGVLEETGADAVQCSYQDVFTDHVEERLLTEQRKVLNTTEYLALFTRNWTCGLLWDKLYRRPLFDGVRFETGHKIDDEYFTYLGMMQANKVALDSKIVYNYRKRTSSVMHSPDSARLIVLDRIDVLNKRRAAVLAAFPELRPVYDRHFLEMLVILSREADASEESIRLSRRCLKAYFREKGHSRPDFRLLPALWKLRFGSLRRILADRKPAEQACAVYTYFA